MGGRTDRVSLTAVRLYRDGAPEEFIDHVPAGRNLIPDLFKDIDWGGIHGFLVPADLVRAVGGFNESLRFFEDWDFFTRLGLLNPELVTDARVGALYRLRPRSMSANRVGMTTTRARLLVSLHDTLRHSQRPGWFGIDLLTNEQQVYQNLVALGVPEPLLLGALLERIKELQRREGFGLYGWRFRLLTRLVGYAQAERIRNRAVKMLRKKSPDSLDTAAWRENG
jgi:hypothetical protein